MHNKVNQKNIAAMFARSTVHNSQFPSDRGSDKVLFTTSFMSYLFSIILI